jgi:ELWxxDGT repeat protein
MISLRSRKALWLLSPLALSLFLSQTALAQPATQVVDLNTMDEQETLLPFASEPFAVLGGELYYASDDGIHGVELWKTDGTAAGSVLIEDICPGACGSMPRGLTRAGSRLLFFAGDAEHGHELWATDGTAAGTSLVADIHPGFPSGAGGLVVWTVEASGTAYFIADDGVHGYELWKSDGTPAGTALVADIWPGPGHSVPSVRAVSGGTLLFEANDGTHGIEPWLTDGTAAGTRLLKDIRPGAESSMGLPVDEGFLATASGLFLFSANDGAHGWELWASDGTEAGTVLTLDIDSGPESGFLSEPLTELGGVAYFTGHTPEHGYELWRTDGTAAGTWLVKDIRPGIYGSAPDHLTVFSGRLFFSAWEEDGWIGLYTSDGTAAGTVRIKETGNAAGLTDVGGQLLFFAAAPSSPSVLWKSDGTEAGTVVVSDFGGQAVPVLPFYSSDVLQVGGRLYFRAFDLNAEIDLWASDGTAAGTVLVAETTSLTSSIPVSPWDGRVLEPGSWGALGESLIYLADDGTTGNEPWVSDGTAAGTEPLTEILPGNDWSYFFDLTPLGNGSALFSTGSLWETDGTPAGTGPLFATGGPADVSGLTRIGSTVFFSGSSTAEGQELWKTDGTAAGTLLVKDILPGAAEAGPFRLTAAGNTLFFVANGGTGARNQELWKSDGTADGTVLVEDIRPGEEPSEIDHATPVAGRLFFTANDGTSGREPWVSDGTADGTFRLKDIASGSDGSIPLENEGITAVVGSTFFFQAGAGADKELWASDGTEAGTRLVKDIHPGSGGSEPRWLTVAGGRLFFTAEDGTHGRELWVSDGTEAGTVLVGDLLPGAGSSLPRELAAVGNSVIFSATDGTHGIEPWASDGTWARRLGDLAPGALPSSPVRFTPVGDQVYFGANDSTSGFELWSLPQSALAGPLDFYTVTPCRLADTRSTTPLLPDQPRTLPVTGSCGIPAEAQAVAVNFTVVAPNGPGFLIAWPTGTGKPETSSLNYKQGITRTNNGVVELGTGGQIDVQGQTGAANGQVHLVIDVAGYFR